MIKLQYYLLVMIACDVYIFPYCHISYIKLYSSHFNQENVEFLVECNCFRPSRSCCFYIVYCFHICFIISVNSRLRVLIIVWGGGKFDAFFILLYLFGFFWGFEILGESFQEKTGINTVSRLTNN